MWLGHAGKVALVIGVVGSGGCSTTPPLRWAEGGARLTLGDTSWNTPDGDVIEIRADGHVLTDGDTLFVLDRAGRVFYENHEPVAVLLPDGRISATDGDFLGRLGRTNAAPPGRTEAWLTVGPDGTVVLYDAEGDREDGGKWRGCGGSLLRTCTLVTHLVTLRRAVAAAHSGPSVGVGIGIYR